MHDALGLEFAVGSEVYQQRQTIAVSIEEALKFGTRGSELKTRGVSVSG